MKKILYISILFTGFASLKAQNLVPDQNPNYYQSMQQYMNDSTYISMQGETVQRTYDAIDPYQDAIDARNERRNNRIAYRHERRMARIENNRYYYRYPYIYNGYYGFGNRFCAPFYRPGLSVAWNSVLFPGVRFGVGI